MDDMSSVAINLNVLHQFKPGEPSEWSSKETHPKVQWQVAVDPETGSQDELFVRGNQVVWYCGLTPELKIARVSYSVETAVLQALWCQFEDSSGDNADCQKLRGVCIREQECLTLYLLTGAVHYVTLPFQVRCVWSLANGLLVERSIPSDGGCGLEGLPTLFTLLHPSDDLCPVTLRRPAEASVDVTVLGFFSDPHQRVLCVCADGDGEPLVVTHNLLSRQHSIWLAQRATQNDVPSHVVTPTKPASNLSTSHYPLSSSAPSYYDNEATPSNLMDTPVEMLLSAQRLRNGNDHAHIPLLTQVQRRGVIGSSGKRDGGSGPKGHMTGRSPYITRLQTPHDEPAAMAKLRSKSLSPHILARISPFSQAVNSHSWSTFYSDEFSFGRKFEPLLPQVCLRRIWREGEKVPGPLSEVATIHKTTDFIGLKYLVLCLSNLQQLWLIPNMSEEGKPPSFGAVTMMTGVQVVPIKGQPFFVVLDVSGGLSLYSGIYKVADLIIQHLLTQPATDAVIMETDDATPTTSSAVSEIRDPLNETFTVVLGSGDMFRCSVLQLFRHPTVSLCLRALRQLLPHPLTAELLTSYYNSSHHLPTSRLPQHFHSWLLSCLGMGGAISESSWQRLQGRIELDNLMAAMPALRLFSSAMMREVASSYEAPPTCPTPCPCLKDHTETVLWAVHLVYEELKLRTLFGDGLPQLAGLLSQISSSLGPPASVYTDHYWRDFPHLLMPTLSPGQPPTQSPPHILQWLTHALTNKPVGPFPTLPDVCTHTAKILKLYSLFCAGEGRSVELNSVLNIMGQGHDTQHHQQKFREIQESSSLPWERVVLCLVEEGLRLSDIETLPVGVALPLWDSIIRCQENPPSTWPQAAYDFIGRRDILESLQMTSDYSHLKMEDPKDGSDGMDMNQEILQLRFPGDQRVGLVRRFLQSVSPVRIALTQKPEVSDHDFLEQQESHLLMLCQRTMALPVGRGMFTISTTKPLPTAHLAIPKLNLSGRVPPKNSAVGLDHIDKPADMSVWAEFHNGVAAGLKIAPGMSQLNRAWIVYNRPSSEVSPNEYAGFLMALGLQGHLSSVPDYDLYNHLKEKHELTTIGLLLGVSTARSGTVSLPLSSLLAIYFPPLLPHGSADMEIPSSIQTTAMLGLGHVYRASGNRHMAEVMLKEIGRGQGPELDFSEDRESYSLTAGLALGLITLGLGNSPLGLSDLHLVDQLCVLMNGGPKTEVVTPRSPPQGYLVLEGDQVNTHVTAPGAILALTLMYLKTNDSAVAATLEAPSTQYDLEGIRPDFLLLRALGHCLIMWDSIEPSMEWIKASHLPPIVSEHAFQGKHSEKVDYQTLDQAYVNILAGSCLGLGLRYAGTCDIEAKHCLLECVRELLTKLESSRVELVGKPCLERCVVTMVLALAVVMSGSGDLDVLRMIRRLRLSHSELTYGSHMAVHMALGLLFIGGGRYSLSRSNESIAALVVSLYPVFPQASTDNRYHLQAFRHLYVLAAETRALVTRDVQTGKTCSVGVEIWTGDNVKRATTPCIVPDWDSIDKICVCSESHWPMTFDLKSSLHSKLKHTLPKSGCVTVKRRTTKLTESSLHQWKCGLGMVRGVIDLSPSDLPSDPVVRMLCQHLALPHMQENSPWTKFLVACLLECVKKEKLQIFPCLLQLEQYTLKAFNFNEQSNTHFLWQIKLAQALSLRGNCNQGNIVEREFTDRLVMRLKNCLEEKAAKVFGSVQKLNELEGVYLRGSPFMAVSEEEGRLLASALVLWGLPHSTQLGTRGSAVVQYILAS